MNHTEPVTVNLDVQPIVQQNVEMNVDSNMEHLDQILLQTTEDSSEDEEMTYISIDDRIKSLVESFQEIQKHSSRAIIKVTTIMPSISRYILCFKMKSSTQC